MPYISITGLKLKSMRYTISFWWHAIGSMNQARAAQGNISADAKTINGVHHTVSVWIDEQAMRTYLVTGPHLKAMKAFHSIATGKTLGFYAEKSPDWDTIHDLWVKEGKVVLPRKANNNPNLE
jgi:hypothetical protein